MAESTSQARPQGSPLEVFTVMLRLGCMAFGGPVAHLAHFQRELIEKRKWLDEHDYADLIAFCQFLPGPASSQVGMGLGLLRAGVPGMFAAWFAFSLPSVILLLTAAAGMGALADSNLSWLHGLLAGVVAIVAHAIYKMGRKLCPTPLHTSFALAAGVIMLLVPHTLTQVLVILLGAAAGLVLLPVPEAKPDPGDDIGVSKVTMAAGWTMLLVLVVLPVLASLAVGGKEPTLLNVYASFAQTGALVFGGGHVVLPMLQAEVVGPGWMADEQFLAGYGITQAMPGPIFTLGSYLGATIGGNVAPGVANFLLYAAAALVGLFMPSFAFMTALFPLWHRLRASVRARQALGGINAAVIGLLIAALYDPVWTKAMNSSDERLSVAVMLGSWLLLVTWKQPAWLVVVLSALAGLALGL
ncbi:MAG: chromate efflux transporter [Proteobacteria bacterium]|nr:chromate efflux transporter [Pseudomonadota bacterium]